MERSGGAVRSERNDEGRDEGGHCCSVSGAQLNSTGWVGGPSKGGGTVRAGECCSHGSNTSNGKGADWQLLGDGLYLILRFHEVPCHGEHV